MTDPRIVPPLQIKLAQGDAVSKLVQQLAANLKFDDVKFSGKGEDDILAVLRFAKGAQIARQELLHAMATIMTNPRIKELLDADESFLASVVVPILKARAEISLKAPEPQ